MRRKKTRDETGEGEVRKIETKMRKEMENCGRNRRKKKYGNWRRK